MLLHRLFISVVPIIFGTDETIKINVPYGQNQQEEDTGNIRKKIF